MSGVTSPPSTPERLSGKRLLIAGLAATAAALAATLLARAVVSLIVPLNPQFPPFSYGSITIFTTVFCLIGVGVFALVNRLSQRPLRTFNMIALVAFFLSILPNLGGTANPTAIPFPGGSAANFAILVLFHIVATVVFLSVLNILAKRAS